ncbi:tRNA guanosine(34) transglycosylase Tgt [Phenylobacterium sp. SCN 70-31]|uniref:tRNA guanosine(34) transglycosylase Tgt n=1 Tax=Phenylobacterium sp. SCN 70-31 TaxID=1660129 RepID=UPI00086E573D|nr:tRNA guanosine(34) transglycosylase Tgt [Phenylobacterium sp. SCN 70-31]ODT87446.1 MAG: tRNA guanosine(34) transglycosylase Tgt [Phenylobacterium sp. SCN 70-31]
MTAFPFTVQATDGRARTGVLSTPRGEIRTPAFMPVGTAATVKALTVDQVAATGADILLGNTYHLMLRPTAERVKRLGGLHRFMRWDRPILTDSGGFQVMSLSKIAKVTEEAVTFQSHLDGSRHVLSPERSMEIQADLLGSDIVMQLDELVALPATPERAGEAMRLSARWGQRSKNAFGERDAQNLFAIQQGGLDPALRGESAERLIEIGFDGYAIGGLAVGEGHQAMCEALDFAPGMLPAERPRYLMGVGKPIDIVEAVYRGVDMFDCVLPTRSGRHGQAWTWDGPLNLKNARFAEDETPLDADSDVPASRDYSKAYLHHLVKSDEILGQVLLSWHNLAFFQALMTALRSAVSEGRISAFRRSFAARQSARPGSDSGG